MQLTLTITQSGKKVKTITTPIASLTFELVRRMLLAQEILNSIPGANLRVHIAVTEN